MRNIISRSPLGGTKDEITMTTQFDLARVIVAGRIHTTQDPALLRTVELARQAEKRSRRRR